MMYKVFVSEQVKEFLKKQAPEPKKKIKYALNGVSKSLGGIKELEAPLEGFYRLRINQFRVLFVYDHNRIDYVFIERRSVVYEIFEEILAQHLTRNK